MTRHATFAPSAATRWLACSGSVRLAMDAPPAPPSSYAVEGQTMHELAARCLTEGLDPREHAPEQLPPDAVDAVAFYCDFIDKRRDSALIHFIEEVVRFDDHLYGTADYLGVELPVLDVTDFKGGAGVLVEAEDNEQMKTYAWLAWQDPHLADWARRCTEVRMTIVQPRAPNGPVREARFGIEELVAHGMKLKRAMRLAANAQLAEFHTGPHCRWCPASPVCPALTKLAKNAPRDPKGMSGDALAAALNDAEILEAYLKSLREYASDQILQGALVPGWVMRPKRAMRRWTDERGAANRLRMLGVEPFESKLISVAVAEKAMKTLEGFEGLWSAESSGYTLDRGEEPALIEKGQLIEQAAKRTK